MTDHHALNRVLRQFARTMASSYDTTNVLHDLSDSVVEVVGATAAGVALLDGENLRFVTATNETGAQAERIQEQLQAGPCFDAIRNSQPVPVGDMRERHGEWPEYAPAVEDIGVRAVLGLPLVLGDRQVGSLDIYSAETREWDDEAIDAAMVLADIGAAYLLNATEHEHSQRTAQQLQTALDTRVIIEQAKGVLAERAGITIDEAFQRIRASARRQSLRTAEVCRRVIETDHVPE